MSGNIKDTGDVLLEELEYVRYRRSGVIVPAPHYPADAAVKIDRYHRQVEDLATPLAALCLSGGGVRSAAFALGITQGLAKRQILEKFDYLSTVSGGGYVGGFLAAWIQRHGFDDVQGQLSGDEPMRTNSPLRHLRNYSNYLTPRTGLFSADRLTMGVIYVRNLLLNWMVLLPVVMLVVAAVKLIAVGAWNAPPEWHPTIAIIAVAFMGMSFVDSVGQRPGPHGDMAESGLFNFYAFEIIPMLIGATLITVAAIGFVLPPNIPNAPANSPVPLSIVPYLAGISAVTGLLACLIALYFSSFARQAGDAPPIGPRRLAIVTSAIVLSWAVGAALIGLAIFGGDRLHDLPSPLTPRHIFIVAGPPVVMLTLFLGEVIYVALTHMTDWSDGEREWLARAAGHHLLAATAWLLLFGLVLLGSLIVFDFVEHPTRLQLAGLAGVGSLAGATTALLGWAKSTTATIKENVKSWIELPRDLVMALATTVFTVSLFVLTSVALDWDIHDGKALVPAHTDTGLTWIVTGLAATIAFATSYIVDINRFSMHGVYRNRLIRTFLGASHDPRQANELTDFDRNDDLGLATIWPGTGQMEPAPETTPGQRPPMLVVNMALNVVGSSQLAWQERKAVSFTATPLAVGTGDLPSTGHSGALPTGYFRNAGDYGGGITLGSAMTVSGAAVSPNMGYSSSPAYSILMTLFNVRLGAWYGNPGPMGDKSHRNPGPLVSVIPLISEALGITTADRRYVYLSDGGHFDNLGIYEMLRRRCRLIVVSDGGEDSKMTFEDLGNALRRAEIDLGVTVRFESFNIAATLTDTTSTCAVATITYHRPERTTGKLLYIKPSRDDRAPLSVRSYALLHEKFPHEPTTDQFFGETQFEAYRALGEHVIDTIAPTATDGSVGGFIAAVEKAAKQRAAKQKKAGNRERQ
ncbi:hypothetical protein C2U70_01570 [Bradyrhizobium guangdongense]|uniref:patatin-like phospholipase family protein n=1 Tax=Bradyrhizobium guangdongense TaxID=1325090 RepID=UPI00112DBEE1|nr:patatin-like phospholipase family protein [Bradyrhizobium guangdongense]TPQ42375.1 hypothetical protein C2U70_01570 [Bradyrhizobium guangdongense]